MPRPKKTDAEIHAMREQILDAAYVLLLEEGPEAISSRAVAERLGMAHMSLYTYFKNQEEILNALRDREMAKWTAVQQALAQDAQTEDLAGLVKDQLDLCIRLARKNPNLYRLAWVMQEDLGEKPELNRERMFSFIGQVAVLLQKGMERAVFEKRDPFLAAAVVLGMVNMLYIFFYTGKMIDPVARDRMAEEMLVAAMMYLRKQPDSPGDTTTKR